MFFEILAGAPPRNVPGVARCYTAGVRPRIEEGDGCVRFEVRVAPRSSRDAILGVHDGALKIALCAPPVDGEANAALVAFLARALGVAKRDVSITRGATSKRKHVEVRGLDEAGLERSLGL